MSEDVSLGSGESIRRHYEDPSNPDPVGERFEVYKHSTPRIDIHDRQIEELGKLGLLTPAGDERERVVCDVGSGKADIYRYLLEHGYVDSYVAVDRSIKQLRHSKDGVLFLARNAMFVQAEADRLPMQDASVDVALANFVLYHESGPEREHTYRELMRILRPEGVIGLSTSGFLNKATQRQRERQIAKKLGIAPPPGMNEDWTSETAEDEIAANFVGWHKYAFVQHGYFIIDNQAKADVSIGSIRTGRDQYSPVPNEATFETVLAELKADMLLRTEEGYPVVDNIDRTFYLLSRNPLDLPDRTLLN